MLHFNTQESTVWVGRWEVSSRVRREFCAPCTTVLRGVELQGCTENACNFELLIINVGNQWNVALLDSHVNLPAYLHG